MFHTDNRIRGTYLAQSVLNRRLQNCIALSEGCRHDDVLALGCHDGNSGNVQFGQRRVVLVDSFLVLVEHIQYELVEESLPRLLLDIQGVRVSQTVFLVEVQIKASALQVARKFAFNTVSKNISLAVILLDPYAEIVSLDTYSLLAFWNLVLGASSRLFNRVELELSIDVIF